MAFPQMTSAFTLAVRLKNTGDIYDVSLMYRYAENTTGGVFSWNSSILAGTNFIPLFSVKTTSNRVTSCGSGYVVNGDAYHDLVMIYNRYDSEGLRLRIYLDNILKATAAGYDEDVAIQGTTLSNKQPFYPGSGPNTHYMDNLGIWNRALNITEIADRYNNNAVAASGLVCYFQCEDNTDNTVVVDSSVNGRDGLASVNTNVLSTASGYQGHGFAMTSSNYFTVANIATRTLTISSDAHGTITTPASSPYGYSHGTMATITAEANSEYTFDHWSGDTANITDVNLASTTINMIADAAIVANFISQKTLTISAGTGGIVIPAAGVHNYTTGEVVAVSVIANSGYRFKQWMGTAVDAGKVPFPLLSNTTVQMDNDYTLEALFEHCCEVSISIVGNGGVVPGVGNFQYADDVTEILLEATPATGFVFVDYSGPAVGYVENPETENTKLFLSGDYMGLVVNFASGGDYIWSPSYVYKTEYKYKNIKTEFENGMTQVRNKIPTVKHIFNLKHNNITPTVKDEIKNFYLDKLGGFNSFSFINPEDDITYTVRFVDDSLITEQDDKDNFNLEVSLEEVL